MLSQRRDPIRLALEHGQRRAERAKVLEPGGGSSNERWKRRRRVVRRLTFAYTSSVEAAIRFQSYSRAARSTPAAPSRARRSGSDSSEDTASARRSGSRGGTCTPVTPSTTESIIPPTAAATTGTPHAIASRGTIPNGSYHGAHTTTSAERISAGRSARETRPHRSTRSATRARSATARSRRASGAASSSSRGGPPAPAG